MTVRLDHGARQPAEGGLLVYIAIPMATLAGEVGEEDRAVEGVA